MQEFCALDKHRCGRAPPTHPKITGEERPAPWATFLPAVRAAAMTLRSTSGEGEAMISNLGEDFIEAIQLARFPRQPCDFITGFSQRLANLFHGDG